MHNKTDTIQKQFADRAKLWAKLKVTYQHMGTSRNGCDCTGLLIGIAKEFGYLKNYELRKYPPDWNLHAGAGNQIIEELNKFTDKIKKNQVGIGDIAVMAFGKCPAHCGIIVADNMLMVHSLATNKKCMFSLLKNSMFSKRWVATYRINETKLKNYDI